MDCVAGPLAFVAAIVYCILGAIVGGEEHTPSRAVGKALVWPAFALASLIVLLREEYDKNFKPEKEDE